MPDRVLRAELLTSEAYLSLKNNDDRVCWYVLFLNADSLGNQPAGPYRLIHLLRHAGIDTPEKVAKVLLELAEVDLIRTYHVAGKPYCHIPRFRQKTRYLGRTWPTCQWNTDEEIQRVRNKSHADHSGSHETDGDAPVEVGVDVDVGVDENLKSMVAASGAPAGLKVKKKAKPDSTTGTRLATDWELPDQWLKWAIGSGYMNEEAAMRESLTFRDYWLAKPGIAGRKVDWFATWRNWIRRAR